MYVIEEYRTPRSAACYNIPAAAIQECGAEAIERAITEEEKAAEAKRIRLLREILAAAWRRLTRADVSAPSARVSAR